MVVTKPEEKSVGTLREGEDAERKLFSFKIQDKKAFSTFIIIRYVNVFDERR